MNTERGQIPVLTTAVARPKRVPAASPPARPALSDEELAAIQVRIATGSFALVESLLHNAFRQMEATLYEELVSRLRHQLPDLVDQVLREHFQDDRQKP